MLYVVIAGALVLVGVPALAWLVGLVLPQGHVAARRLTVSRPPGEVWPVLADIGGQITWRSVVKGVSKVADADHDAGAAGEVWREVIGRHAFDLKTLEATPPEGNAPGRLVRELVTPGLPFRGRWEYVVAPEGQGSLVTVTERGEVLNPAFRSIQRFVVGQASSVEAYLRDLARRLGEPARIGRGL